MEQFGRALGNAARDSPAAVLDALRQRLHEMHEGVDAMLVFEPAGEELLCVYAAGRRTEHFAGSRVRVSEAGALPGRALLCGHRVVLESGTPGVIPTDRSAIAVPFGADGTFVPVAYVSSLQPVLAEVDRLVEDVQHTAMPYSLASDRRRDRERATYDGLTGLLTPRALRDHLRVELDPARRARGEALCLWFIDTDRFKEVNDKHGHAAGDMVLGRMAALLRAELNDGIDSAARNGGDEFCAILRDCTKVTAIERAQRFCDRVRSCDFGLGTTLTASVGVAAFPHDAADAAQLLEAADAAMYHSKRDGRDRVSFPTGRGAFAVYR